MKKPRGRTGFMQYRTNYVRHASQWIASSYQMMSLMAPKSSSLFQGANPPLYPSTLRTLGRPDPRPFRPMTLPILMGRNFHHRQLSYRGIVYEKELPLIEMETGEYGGRYRGQSWHYRYPRHVFNQNSNKINPLSRSTHSLSSLTTQAAFANDSSVCAVPMATAHQIR